jgi:hypothetical protein
MSPPPKYYSYYLEMIDAMQSFYYSSLTEKGNYRMKVVRCPEIPREPYPSIAPILPILPEDKTTERRLSD